MEYQFKSGTRFNVPAEVVGGALERLRAQNNDWVLPSAFVDDSRPEDSPTHRAFIWDDHEAAEIQRVDQARRLIRSLVCVHHVAYDEPPKVVQCYVHIAREDDQQGYLTTARVMSDPELRQTSLEDAMRGLEAWRKRCEHLNELQVVFQAIDAFARQRTRKTKQRKAAARKADVAARA